MFHSARSKMPLAIVLIIVTLTSIGSTSNVVLPSPVGEQPLAENIRQESRPHQRGTPVAMFACLPTLIFLS